MFKRIIKGKQKQKEELLAHIKLHDFYKHYKSNYMKLKNRLISKDSPYYVDKSTYTNILEDFNLLLRKQIIEGKTITIPLRMGNLAIRKYKAKVKVIDGKIKGLAPNWKETLDLWENDESAYKKKTLVRHLNKNTNGFIAKIDWLKSSCKIKNRSYFKFIPCRTFKRAVKDVLKDEFSNIDYLEYDNSK